MEEMDKILTCSPSEYPKGTFPGRENEGQEKKEEAPEGKTFSINVEKQDPPSIARGVLLFY
jgi:hypothetical protein